MGLGFWGGIIGWAAAGPIGALVGYVIGKITEAALDASRLLPGGGPTAQGSAAQGSTGRTAYDASAQRNSFLMSLLVLSSAVIRADGRFLQSEMDYVRGFIRQNFGETLVPDAMKALEELNAKDVNIYSVGTQIARNMNYSQRLQLFHYLVELANADGELCAEEKSVLEAIAASMSVSASDASSMISMYYSDADSAYRILEISRNATDDEVKAAYRRMAMKYHPDKVASLGPDVQKSAEEKFRKVKEAYEQIKKQRRMS